MISAPPSRELSIAPDASSVLIPASAITRRRFTSESSDLSLLQIATLVVWIACLGAGGLGLALHYGRPAPKAVPAPIQAPLLRGSLRPRCVDDVWSDSVTPRNCELVDWGVPPFAPIAVDRHSGTPLCSMPA